MTFDQSQAGQAVGFIHSLKIFGKYGNLQTDFSGLENVQKIKVKTRKMEEKSGFFPLLSTNLGSLMAG